MDGLLLHPHLGLFGGDDKSQPHLSVSEAIISPSLTPLPSINDTRRNDTRAPIHHPSAPQTAESEIFETLKNSPSVEHIIQCLQKLNSNSEIHKSSATGIQIINILLSNSLPDFWAILGKKERLLFVKSLSSPMGLCGIVAHLKGLTSKVRAAGAGVEADTGRENLRNLLELLQLILFRHGFLYRMWLLIGCEEPGKKLQLMWKEFSSFIAGGKVLSAAAEADYLVGRPIEAHKKRLWVGNGKQFALWLGREVAEACLRLDTNDEVGWKALTLIFTASFSLGYTESIVEGLNRKLEKPRDESQRLQKLIFALPGHNKRSYMIALLQIMSSKLLLDTKFQNEDEKWWTHDMENVSGAAALLGKITLHDDDFRNLLMEWLTSTSGGGVGEHINIRRTIIAVMVEDQAASKELFEKSLQQFADKLWIKHIPIIRQEANVQILLLLAGHFYRSVPAFLSKAARSSDFLNGVSNRLSASSQRARFLGMIVGESFSSMVDKDDKMKMSFETEETSTENAKWWKSIPFVNDKIRSTSDLFTPTTNQVDEEEKKTTASTTATSSASEDIDMNLVDRKLDDYHSGDDEFEPYKLPDSDPDDPKDEDATTIDRNKPHPPVYVRDLLTYFHATDSYDRQLLALTHAGPLIRRKGTGKDVTSHIPELVAALAGIDDRFDIPGFSSLKISGLVALAVTNPSLTGPQLARQFFIGDYGLSQRAGLLLAIGLAARELSGLSDPPTATVPSRTPLPAKSAAVWGAPPEKEISRLTTSLQNTLLTPMAASAADKLTGPAILKVRIFSSRMAVEARRSKAQHRPIIDVAANAFFFPLTGGWWVAVREGPCISSPPQADPHILSLLIETLALLTYAVGPFAPTLPQMTAEMIQFLLSLRRAADSDVRICRAILVGLLTVLEINGDNSSGDGSRKLAETHAGEVVEIKEWVEGIFSGPYATEEEVKSVAAGVLVKISEIAETYRKTLMSQIGVIE